MTEEEFDAFYSASYPRLVGQLFAMTGDWAEAQDVVQEAFIRAWDRRSRFDLHGAPEAWIRTVAWRLAVSRLRRLRRGAELLRRHHVEQVVAPPGVEHLAIVQALSELGEHQRRAVALHYLCDLSIEDIAAETGATINAVKSRLARGRVALAAALTAASMHTYDESEQSHRTRGGTR
jgi:RNA polymerase sigma-70 factor (ECF subfamily)